MTMTKCVICGEGQLHACSGEQDVSYREHNGQIPYAYLECDLCGSETAGPIELRQNKRAMTEFKRSVDGLLTGAEIRQVRQRHNLTQTQAADLFGGGPVAFSKYEAGDVTQSEAMDRLLRVFDMSLDARRLIEQMSVCSVQNYLVAETVFDKVGKVTIIHLTPDAWIKSTQALHTHFLSFNNVEETVLLSKEDSDRSESLILAG
jgi:putative zinc finger/helix-turn-helix YgiT family protein